MSGIELDSASLCLRKYGESRPTLKHTIINRIMRRKYTYAESFWVLKDINLKIDHGERVGLIGENGTGKTTLLKMLTGVYRPTHGTVSIRGMITPLIGIGGSVQNELSGIENIYMTGAIMGYPPSLMRERIPAILQFAGLEKFSETPLKYYSSGMMVRLFFAIFTEIIPEILISDEVFAAGDAGFVDKAKKRIMEVVDNSHIAIFASHNMELLNQITNRTIWLKNGSIEADGPTSQVCDEYLRFVKQA